MQNAITEAVQIYNDLTCVRFVPRNQASGLPHASYLYLTRGYGQSKSVVLVVYSFNIIKYNCFAYSTFKNAHRNDVKILYFSMNNQGCASFVGRQYDGKQDLTLQDPMCSQVKSRLIKRHTF